MTASRENQIGNLEARVGAGPNSGAFHVVLDIATVHAQAANLHGLTLPMLLPGITLNTGPHDYQPIKQMYLRRFNGQSWDLLEEATASISKE